MRNVMMWTPSFAGTYIAQPSANSARSAITIAAIGSRAARRSLREQMAFFRSSTTTRSLRVGQPRAKLTIRRSARRLCWLVKASKRYIDEAGGLLLALQLFNESRGLARVTGLSRAFNNSL